MQSFQTLASLIVLTLLASKEAAALPQPQIAGFFGSPGPVVLPAGPSFGVNRPIPIGTFGPGPQMLSGDTAAGILDAAGNIDPTSLNARDELDLEARQYYPGYYYPAYYPSVGNYATSTIGTAGNQIGVASGNINPTSTNYPRDLEARQYYPGYYYPAYYPSGNYAGSSIGTVGNQIGVASGNISPSSTNYPREN